MSHIFISYSRSDVDFAKKLVDALAAMKLDTWIDLESIPKGEDWEQEIYRGIQEADAFLFLISPDSVISKMCNKEIAHAVKNHKRILPIVFVEADLSQFPDETARTVIQKRNWILCRDGRDDFNKAVAEIYETIHTDYEWLKFHKEIQVKALKWEAKKDNSLLLRGRDLKEAEQIFATRGSDDDPAPTTVQRTFLLKSRQYAKYITRVVTSSLIAIFLIIGVLSLVAVQQRQSAIGAQSTAIVEAKAHATAQVQVTEQKNIADTRQLSAIAQNLSLDDGHTAIISGLLAVEAARHYPELEPDALYRYLNSKVVSPVSSMKLEGGVGAVAFSPDGKWAVASSGSQIKIWDIATDQEVRQILPILIPQLTYIQFSENGKWLLTTDCDQSDGSVLNVPHCANTVARLFDTTTWKETSRLSQNYGNGIVGSTVVFSPDSQTIASVGNDGTLIVWDASTGEKIFHAASGCIGACSPVVFSPDGKLILSGSASGSGVTIWDAASGREVSQTLQNENISSLVFHPNRSWVASASDDSIVKIWDVNTGDEVTRLTFDSTSSIFSMKFSPDGKWLITVHNDNTVRVWEIAAGQEVSRMTGNASVTPVDISPDGNWVVSAGRNIGLIWEAATGREVARLFHDDSVNSLAFSPDGKHVISGSSDGTARVWEINTYQDTVQLKHDGLISAIVFSSNGKWVASGSWDGTTRVWDASTGQERSRQTVDGLITALAFSSDDQWVAQAACEGASRGVVACGEPVIRIWEANSGTERFELKPKYGVETVKFLPDRKSIVIADTRQRIQVLALENGKVIRTFEPDLTGFTPAGASGAMNAFAVSMDVDPSGQRLATGSINSVQVWDLNSAQELYRIPRDGFSAVAFSSDGKWIVSARNDIQMSNAETGEEIKRISIDLAGGTVGRIAVSPDGKWIAGVSGTMIRVWEVSTGEEITRLARTYTVHAVAFSPDGKWLASGGDDNIARLSLWRNVDLLAEVCKRLPRNLTREEWRQYLGDEPYRATCGDLPLVEAAVPVTSTPSPSTSNVPSRESISSAIRRFALLGVCCFAGLVGIVSAIVFFGLRRAKKFPKSNSPR